MTGLRVAHLVSEISPYAKTGGLADVAAALSAGLRRAGVEVRVFVPLYGSVDARAHALEPAEELGVFSVELGARRVEVSFLRASPRGGGFPVDFVRCPALYDRRAIYTSDRDEPLRFLLLQRAALAACRRLGWAPDIVHAHDWHAGLAPMLLRTEEASEGFFGATRSVLTIHNVGYPGIFEARLLHEAGVPGAAAGEGARLGFLETGIRWADRITTVSPTYAREILTSEYGMGLEGVLRERADALVGILNGVDLAVWNPRTDPFLAVRYSARTLGRKAANRDALLAEVGLSPAGGGPVIGMITRLVWQKGIDLLFESLPPILASHDVRLVVLGEGEERYESFFGLLERRFPGRVRFVRGFDVPLAHRIEAGADLFLMPSRYEPCGLNQMYSRIYGTVPLVRRTGGLADTVEPWDPKTRRGSGIVFERAEPSEVREALERAVAAYADRQGWSTLMRNAMDCDFSWDGRVEEYLEVYETARRARRPEPPG